MSRRREAGFSFLEGMLHTFGVMGFVLLLSCVVTILSAACIQIAAHHKLPAWVFTLDFIVSTVCVAVTMSKFLWGKWANKISIETQNKIFGFIWIIGLLFIGVIGICALVLPILAFLAFLRKH